MKMFMLLSCLVGSTMAAVSGDLAVTSADDVISVQGQLTGLPADTGSVTPAGIHIHEGKICDTVHEDVGGHLWSNHIDGWAYPAGITYSTNDAGEAAVDVSASSFTLATADGTLAIPAVENRCIVLHGVASDNLPPRVAVGQILKNADGDYKAAIGAYPGPASGLATTPAGELTVTVDGETVTIQGSLTGLGVSLTGAGIHIHSGMDCSGGADVSTADAEEVNAVIGGHLYSKGDGFDTTTYTANAAGEADIDFSTPAGSYTLLTAAETEGAPSVEGRCIVIHADGGDRIGVGQIVCTDGTCTAAMGEYPAASTAAASTAAASTAAPDTTTLVLESSGMMASITTMAIAVVALW